MRWKLLKRRLSISAPRMTVRSHLPWPLRWAAMALTLGLSAALALWAFEFGKGIAGIDDGSKEELVRLRDENKTLSAEREKLISTVNTSESLMKTEKSVQDKLAMQVKQLEATNAQLKDDLRFFERLIPSNEEKALAIRALQVEPGGVGEYKYRLLVIQTGKNPPEFNGRYDLQLTGTQGGKPWSGTFPGSDQQAEAPYRLSFKSYQRVEGALALPPDTVIKSIQARVVDKNGVRSTQTVKL
jgi:cell division protein FtsB